MASPSALRHDAAGLVSLVVKEEKERVVTERLVAMKGKLVGGGGGGCLGRPRL
jgi:hypothetical protein